MGFEYTIKSQNFIKIVGAIFWESLNVWFFLMWIALNLTVSLKWKKGERIYLQGALDIEIGWDWSVGLCAPLGDGHTEKLNFFSVSGIFTGKAESVTLLGFEYTVNLQNFLNFVWAIFEKIDIL